MREHPKLIKYIRSRMWRNDQNFFCSIVGKTGTCKSTAALSLAFAVDKKFDIKTNLFYSIADFGLYLVSKRNHRGRAYILDEIGTEEGWGARDFMKKDNKNMSYVIQAFRMLNCCVITTLPLIGMLDKHGRDLSYAILKATESGIDKLHGVNRLIIKKFETDSITGKDYFKYFRKLPKGGGERKRMPYLYLQIPGLEYIRLYKKIKKEETWRLLESCAKNIKIAKAKEDAIPDEPNAHCNKCGHDWLYTGKRLKPRCNQCNSMKVVVMVRGFTT